MLHWKLTAAVSHLALMASSVSLAGDAGDLNPVTFHTALEHQPVVLVTGAETKGEIVVPGTVASNDKTEGSGEGGRLLSQAVGDLRSGFAASSSCGATKRKSSSRHGREAETAQ